MSARVLRGRTIIVREAQGEDLPAIQSIYAHHVLHGVATFEEVPPSVDELRARRTAVLASGLPYVVAEIGGQLVGYGYATPWRSRPAYRGNPASVALHRRFRFQPVGTLTAVGFKHGRWVDTLLMQRSLGVV